MATLDEYAARAREIFNDEVRRRGGYGPEFPPQMPWSRLSEADRCGWRAVIEAFRPGDYDAPGTEPSDNG